MPNSEPAKVQFVSSVSIFCAAKVPGPNLQEKLHQGLTMLLRIVWSAIVSTVGNFAARSCFVGRWSEELPMSHPQDCKQPHFHLNDALTGIGLAVLVALSAVFYGAGHQAHQPSTIWSDPAATSTE
jgi:hypothetical protein